MRIPASVEQLYRSSVSARIAVDLLRPSVPHVMLGDVRRWYRVLASYVSGRHAFTHAAPCSLSASEARVVAHECDVVYDAACCEYAERHQLRLPSSSQLRIAREVQDADEIAPLG